HSRRTDGEQPRFELPVRGDALEWLRESRLLGGERQAEQLLGRTPGWRRLRRQPGLEVDPGSVDNEEQDEESRARHPADHARIPEGPDVLFRALDLAQGARPRVQDRRAILRAWRLRTRTRSGPCVSSSRTSTRLSDRATNRWCATSPGDSVNSSTTRPGFSSGCSRTRSKTSTTDTSTRTGRSAPCTTADILCGLATAAGGARRMPCSSLPSGISVP